MKNIFSHFKKQKLMYGLAFVTFFLGVVATLSFEPLRFTHYVEPYMDSREPVVVYQEMLDSKGGYMFIDVRTPAEYTALHATTSENIPIQFLFDKWKELPREGKTIYLICSGGRLAGVAYGFLQLHGFTNIVHVSGGVQHWAEVGLPTVAKPVFFSN